MLTLEKHLLECCHANSQYELLNSIWNLNKKFIPNAQSAISFNFPHYSLHENSHSETIIKNIESFLGEERIRHLSPTDTWLILMAAFTHDLGMIVFHEALEKKWNNDDFQEYLRKLEEHSYDKDLQEAAKLLLNIYDFKPEDKHKINLPLEVRKAVVLITADYFRRNHHQRSREMITGADQEFSRLINGFNLNGIPGRFANVLGEIAYAHGIDFYTIFDRLEYTANGFGNDKMHPRFVACLLRLGDLLDVDDKRFNAFNEKVLANELPHTSKLHADKHAAVKHLLVCPSSIEVTVDCQTDEVYRVAREWFDFLQKEVENQSREWASIAPNHLQGMPPTISKGKIRVLYMSAEPKEELMNLRFAISNQKVFEMFEGSAIYDNAEFVFLREMIQNALDASKIQLWRLIKTGVYDYTLRKHLNLKNDTSHEDIIKAIQFPIDIPEEIMEAFPIDLTVAWKDKEKSVLLISVEDRGTGIAEMDLIRMTQKVGESRSSDKEFQEFKKSMPYWLKPTGAFGIGLQSLFLISKYFTVHTKAESEPAREIIFYSAKHNDYSRITKTVPLMKRGTKVIIEIPKDQFDNVFINSFNTDIVDRYDIFTDTYGDIFLHKMERYIENKFQNLPNINFIFLGVKKNWSPSGNFKDKTSNWLKKGDIAIGYSVKQIKNDFAIHVYESIIGSNILMDFADKFPNEHGFHFENKYLVRGIPVKETFNGWHLISYFFMQWGFESPESDKILNISRDKLIAKTKRKYIEIFLDEILPTIVPSLFSVYNNIFLGKSDKNTIIEYFHFLLTARMCGIEHERNDNVLKTVILPSHIGSKLDCTDIMLSNFFYVKTIMHIRIEHKDRSKWQEVPLQPFYDTSLKPHYINQDIDLVIWNWRYLESYFMKCGYVITTYNIHVVDDMIAHVEILSKPEEKYVNVICNEEGEAYIMNKFHQLSYASGRRETILPIDKYKNLAVKVYFDGFGVEVHNVNHFIISPFTNIDDLLAISNECKSYLDGNNKDEFKKILEGVFIKKFVPDNMADWIIENKSTKDDIDRDTIRRDYKNLITDIFFNFKESKFDGLLR